MLVASLQAGLPRLVFSAVHIQWKGTHPEHFSDLRIYTQTVVNLYLYNSWEVLNEKGAMDCFFSSTAPCPEKNNRSKMKHLQKN